MISTTPLHFPLIAKAALSRTHAHTWNHAQAYVYVHIYIYICIRVCVCVYVDVCALTQMYTDLYILLARCLLFPYPSCLLM